MSNPNAGVGVCAACKYNPECIYEAASSGVILQCEQFELAFPVEAARPTSTQPHAMAGRVADENGYAGLCANCDNRATCIYPRPEGGVWRCEEYV